MCNFIMSGKVWAVEKWMSLEEYEKLTVGSMDIKQEVSATSQAVINVANKWNITPEQALEVIKNHATEANTLGIMEEMADTGTTYSVYNIKLQPTEEEIKKYNMRIFGRKTITPPTPPIIPSISKSFKGPSAILFRIRLPNWSTSHSIPCIG